MFSVIDFLPRLAEVKYAESLVSRPCRSLTHGGPKARESSPLPGRSTLMTSAPRSARDCAAHGPASTRDRSMTLMPASGPIRSAVPSDDLQVALQFPIGDGVEPLAPFPFARGGEVVDEV